MSPSFSVFKWVFHRHFFLFFSHMPSLHYTHRFHSTDTRLCGHTRVSRKAPQLYMVRQKFLTVFEIWRPTSPLCGASVLVAILHSEVWSLGWSMHHRVATLELSEQIQPFAATQRGFWRQCRRLDVTSRYNLLLCVLKWRQEGSAKDGKPQVHERSVGTTGNVERRRDAILRL